MNFLTLNWEKKKKTQMRSDLFVSSDVSRCCVYFFCVKVIKDEQPQKNEKINTSLFYL